MIRISLDEGYVFDILAIIEVKNKIRKIDNKDDPNYQRVFRDIAQEIGIRKLDKILKSREYEDLLKDNKQVFGLVEHAQLDNGLAKMVDVANHQRFISKTKLQKKFFKSKPTEVKIGYAN